MHEENYAGGSMAIARNLSALGCEVTLILPHGGEQHFTQLLASYASSTHVNIIPWEVPGLTTPKKSRYITQYQNQRVFELIQLDTNGWSRSAIYKQMPSFIEIANNADLAIVCDFGHGLIEDKVLNELQNIKSFLGLNVQTNSGNYGYNFFHKHQRFDYLSIDEREARLGQHDRLTDIKLVARDIYNRIERPLSITLGTSGSMFYDQDGACIHCPTYFSETIDTTGAGDSYFAITSLLVEMNVDNSIVPFLGNLYAGLNTRIIGNKHSVDKVDLIRTVKALLG